jgi:Na+-driven multidrug efflux pump
VRSFRIYLCLIFLSMMNKGTFIYLQAMGKALLSTMISLTREVIFGVSLPIILPRFFGLDGLLYSFPLADILTFVFALVVIIRTYRELSSPNPALE